MGLQEALRNIEQEDRGCCVAAGKLLALQHQVTGEGLMPLCPLMMQYQHGTK